MQYYRKVFQKTCSFAKDPFLGVLTTVPGLMCIFQEHLSRRFVIFQGSLYMDVQNMPQIPRSPGYCLFSYREFVERTPKTQSIGLEERFSNLMVREILGNHKCLLLLDFKMWNIGDRRRSQYPMIEKK